MYGWCLRPDVVPLIDPVSLIRHFGFVVAICSFALISLTCPVFFLSLSACLVICLLRCPRRISGASIEHQMNWRLTFHCPQVAFTIGHYPCYRIFNIKGFIQIITKSTCYARTINADSVPILMLDTVFNFELFSSSLGI